jgi:hypothetical protein
VTSVIVEKALEFWLCECVDLRWWEDGSVDIEDAIGLGWEEIGNDHTG